MPQGDDLFTVIIELQKTIDTGSDTYRVDFYAYLTRWWHVPKQPTWAPLVVEVDGHDFHDRTKEQAASDRKRDRDLLALGVPVMRYTGSEVYNDPHLCAEYIVNQITTHACKTLSHFCDTGQLSTLIFGPND